MASKIKTPEWIGLYVVTGSIDVIQLLADIFLTEFAGAPEEVGFVADFVIGASLLAYFQLRGVQIINDYKRLASLLGATGLGEVSPAWIIDVWYIHRTVRREEAEDQAATAAAASIGSRGTQNNINIQNRPNGPVNRVVNGSNVRIPDNDRQKPLNIKVDGTGMRPPSPAKKAMDDEDFPLAA